MLGLFRVAGPRLCSIQGLYALPRASMHGRRHFASASNSFEKRMLVPSRLGQLPRLCCHRNVTKSYGQRAFSSGPTKENRNASAMLYLLSIIVAGIGVSYAAVPLYKVFCQVTGYGGTTRQVTMEDARKMVPVPGSTPITVQFAASTSDTLPWKFKPQQKEVSVVPGETALAFYTAYNKSDKAITGVATYNITPAKAGIYFNKIQCFCFDQQRLKPHEEVDMPVFFYIDPTFADDPQMANVENIVLSYTFFQAKN